ncbi:uncharacterized protein LOC143261749 [Megalopta genalis]|uniref:uncharacterized protein LOC143261749 n=1 Tax=Megalopta genalis TaxID=115081 RepID=UPI003FD496B8
MECSRTNTESCIEWGSIEGGEIEFESLTEDTLEGALQVIRKSFFPNESICKAVNLISAPCSVRALEELCVEIAKDGGVDVPGYAAGDAAAKNCLSTKMGTGYITMTVSSINRVTAARENRNAVRIRSITSFNRPMIA